MRNKDDHKRKWGREEKELHRKMDIFQRFSTKEVTHPHLIFIVILVIILILILT